MATATPSPTAPSRISDAERARRAEAVSFGRGSTRLEGGILSAEAEAINARFVSGELSQAEWLAAVLASETVRGGDGR